VRVPHQLAELEVQQVLVEAPVDARLHLKMCWLTTASGPSQR
jgi:hypothetical protein